MAQPPRARIVDALHRTRMLPYLNAAHQNEKGALTLYRWHAELSAACQVVLGVTEVILRNAMDNKLQQWNNRQSGGSRSWLLDNPEAPLRSLSSGKRNEAKERAKKAVDARTATHPRFGVPMTHDDVLAQVTFGLWKDLLPNHVPAAGNTTENNNRMRLWTEALEAAFPNEVDTDGSLTFWRVAHVHKLRNRVSHMESLLDFAVADTIQDAFNLLQSIDRDVANWVTGMSRVSSILKDRPDV